MKARRAAQSLSDQIRDRLDSRMKDGGPAAALKVCAYQSQGVSKDLEQTQGVSLKRATLKPRNAANGADPWEKAVLEKYAASAQKGYGMEEVFELVPGKGGGRGTWRYARPILVQKGCLVCHGSPSEIPADVAEGIRDRYPGDAAAGYRLGDLRGIVSVSFPE
jgi:hypothetical protein